MNLLNSILNFIYQKKKKPKRLLLTFIKTLLISKLEMQLLISLANCVSKIQFQSYRATDFCSTNSFNPNIIDEVKACSRFYFQKKIAILAKKRSMANNPRNSLQISMIYDVK